MKYRCLRDSAIFHNSKRNHGMALIEVIVSIAIFSTVILRIHSAFIVSMNIISDSKNYTKALIIAKSLMNDFRNNNMREADIADSPVDNYPDFTYDRETIVYEDDFITPVIAPLIINQTTITVKWKYKDEYRNSQISMIYQAK